MFSMFGTMYIQNVSASASATRTDEIPIGVIGGVERAEEEAPRLLPSSAQGDRGVSTGAQGPQYHAAGLQ